MVLSRHHAISSKGTSVSLRPPFHPQNGRSKTAPLQYIVSALFPLALASAAAAQSVRWETTDDVLGARVNLVFEDCQPAGTPTLPEIPGLRFLAAGSASSAVYRSGGTMQTQTLHYIVDGHNANTPLALPEFRVKTNRGEQPVAALTARLAPPSNSTAKSHLRPARADVWVGETFALDYELIAARRFNPQMSPTFEWRSAPLLIEEWSKPEVSETHVNDERQARVVFHTRAVAPSPAKLKLETASHPISVQINSASDVVSGRPRMEQTTIISDQPEIQVRALPEPPEGFSGAVGQFTISTRVAPLTAAVGEPVMWTQELKGTGNWPMLSALPSREVSTDFETVQPRPAWKPSNGKFFDGSVAEDVVLVPTKAGTYELPGVTFTYFDPASGTYQSSTAPGATLTITAPPPDSPPPYTGARKAPAAAATQKVGGASFRPTREVAASALSGPEQELERIRSQDSPSRLFQLMRTDNPTAPKNGKN